MILISRSFQEEGLVEVKGFMCILAQQTELNLFQSTELTI